MSLSLAALRLTAAPALTKKFDPLVIGPNSFTTLTFTITNTQGNPQQTGIGFADVLPPALQFDSVVSNTCGGATTISSDKRTFTLTNAQLVGPQLTGSGKHDCQIALRVRSTFACGLFPNTPSNVLGPSNLEVAAVNASLQVSGCAVPLLTKTFTPAKIAPNGTASVTFTISNPSGGEQQGIAFTDALPPGLIFTNVVNSNCGTVSVISNGQALGLIAGKLGGGQQQCTITAGIRSTGLCGVFSNTKTNISGASNLDVAALSAQMEVAGCTGGAQQGLTVRKRVDGAPAGFTGQFPFLVQCATPAGLIERTVSVTWPTPGFIVLNDVPPGSQCTVVEGPLPASLPAGFTWSGLPQYTPAGTITTTSNGGEVSVTNAMRACTPTGKVTVRTTLQGTSSGFAGEFKGTLQCWAGGKLTTHPVTLTAPSALTAVVPDVPLGSSCTFVETAQPALASGMEWNAPVYAPPFGAITLDDQCCKEVTVINQARTCCTVGGVTTCVVTP